MAVGARTATLAEAKAFFGTRFEESELQEMVDEGVLVVGFDPDFFAIDNIKIFTDRFLMGRKK